MSQKRVTKIALLVIIILGLGWLFWPSPSIKKEERKTEKIIRESTKKVDSLSMDLTNIRKNKNARIVNAIRTKKNAVETKLEEYQKRYASMDSSIIFSDTITLITDSGKITDAGRGVISGVIEENEIQKEEISKLDSISSIKSTIIAQKDTLYNDMSESYKKKIKKKNKIIVGIGIAAAIVTGILICK